MAEPVYYNTDIGLVRLLIPDTAPVTQGRLPDSAPAFIFTDEQIEGFLRLNSNNVKLAAADAIDTVATDEALISKVIKTEDLQTDGAKLLEAMRKRAVELRRSGLKELADSEYEFVAYPGCDPHAVHYLYLAE